MTEAPLIEVRDLKKYFASTAILGGGKSIIKAVDGVSFDIGKNEVLSLIGESGSGKTTTGRLVLRLIEPTSGSVKFMGREIFSLDEEEMRKLRKDMQIVFQDPYASLNPRMKIGDAVAEPLIVSGMADHDDAREKAIEMLERVGLIPGKEIAQRLPHNLSGGQRQRVVIARAMITRPKFIVADEAVSMLDMSIKASIVSLLESFRRESGLSMLFITHDLSIAKLISDRVAIMYLGKIVEIGGMRQIIENPAHPYTKALLEAVPSISRRKKEKTIELKGEMPDPRNPPSGCRFRNRCPFASNICSEEEPSLIEIERGHLVACHFPLNRKR
ncbi:MAG TPA: ABC transporter ATP-binding protein [Fervidicoccus fontis]|jgi:peptide/nickel transport system ATP-binding protein|uniref:ABC transporter ATP-binding protein n=1 Tax=Fervidicoccus fontis TaxID=683846 RepID=A0A7C2UUC9_9CREN|nr:MAG: oligopeptide ABC transporter ATP-binding protein [Fervidicoccus sp.]HEU97703.1 ABC transporter ATP-binding protein [Fervidicoccus fontis]